MIRINIITKSKTIKGKRKIPTLSWAKLEEYFLWPTQGEAKIASELFLSLIKTSLPRLYSGPFVNCLSSQKSGTLCPRQGLIWFPSKPHSDVQPQLLKLNNLQHWLRCCKTQLTVYKTGKRFLFLHFLLQPFWAVTLGGGCFPLPLGSVPPPLEEQFPVLQTPRGWLTTKEELLFGKRVVRTDFRPRTKR